MSFRAELTARPDTLVAELGSGNGGAAINARRQRVYPRRVRAPADPQPGLARTGLTAGDEDELRAFLAGTIKVEYEGRD